MAQAGRHPSLPARTFACTDARRTWWPRRWSDVHVSCLRARPAVVCILLRALFAEPRPAPPSLVAASLWLRPPPPPPPLLSIQGRCLVVRLVFCCRYVQLDVDGDQGTLSASDSVQLLLPREDLPADRRWQSRCTFGLYSTSTLNQRVFFFFSVAWSNNCPKRDEEEESTTLLCCVLSCARRRHGCLVLFVCRLTDGSSRCAHRVSGRCVL